VKNFPKPITAVCLGLWGERRTEVAKPTPVAVFLLCEPEGFMVCQRVHVIELDSAKARPVYR